MNESTSKADDNKTFPNALLIRLGLRPKGWLTRREKKLLQKYARLSSGDFLEVGSFQGLSARVLGNIAHKKGVTLHCVDSWEGERGARNHEIFKKFTKNLPVISYRVAIENWEPSFEEDKTFGLIYLDGDHTRQGTLNQITAVQRYEPRYIAAHDWSNQKYPGVREACDSFGMKPIEIADRLAIFEI